MGSLTWYVVRVALIAAAAIFFIVRAWRKRRLDAVPFCNGCGYRLDGSASAACSECGLDLTNKSNIRIGHRGHRRRVLTFGSILLMTSLALAVFVVWPAVQRHDWQTAKPEWWLRSDLRSKDIDLAEAAEAEVRRRAAKTFDSVEAATTVALVDAILKRQADPARRWDELRDAPLFARLFTEGRLARGQAARFLQQTGSVQFRPRQQVQPGGWLPIGWVARQTRGAIEPVAVGSIEINSITLNGKTLPPPPKSDVAFVNSDSKWDDLSGILEPIALPNELRVGKATLGITYTFRQQPIRLLTGVGGRAYRPTDAESADLVNGEGVERVEHVLLALTIATPPAAKSPAAMAEEVAELLESVRPRLYIGRSDGEDLLLLQGRLSHRLRGRWSLVAGDETALLTRGILECKPTGPSGLTVTVSPEASVLIAQARRDMQPIALRFDPVDHDWPRLLDHTPIWPVPVTWPDVEVALLEDLLICH